MAGLGDARVTLVAAKCAKLIQLRRVLSQGDAGKVPKPGEQVCDVVAPGVQHGIPCGWIDNARLSGVRTVQPPATKAARSGAET